ncbi:penicillin-binding protein, partial [Candidatus Saccharibacteria bacterium]|nr:penicillin-binding protein [Candidatus Saccharibacteria bacterium]
MREEGFITQEEEEEATKQELQFAPQRTDIKAPHFVMYVKELLVNKYGLRQVEEGGLEVTTSLDLATQDKVQEIVKNEVTNLWRLHITNGAALVT